MKHLLIILILILLLSSHLLGKSEETCYVSVEGFKGFNLNLLSQISKSLISQYFKPVKNLPPSGLNIDACIYKITVTKEGDTTFVVFSGEDLNSYGDSKLSGADGFQQSLLKSLHRSLRDKRKLICEDYGEFIEKCGSVVVQDVPKQVEPKVVEEKVTIPKVVQKVVQKPSPKKNEMIKTCYVRTYWNGRNYFIFPNELDEESLRDSDRPFGIYVEVLLSFTNKLNLDILFIEEKAGRPGQYLRNCMKRVRNGEIDIMAGIYDERKHRKLMELIPTYPCPPSWNCREKDGGGNFHYIGISKKSKYIQRIAEFKSAALSSRDYVDIYETYYTLPNQHDWSSSQSRGIIRKDN